MTSSHFGTWVKESAKKDASTNAILYNDESGKTIPASKVHWAALMDQSYQDKLTTTESKHLSINSAGRLVPVFDSNAEARFICEQKAIEIASGTGFGGAANKPLERSLLSFNPNV